MAAEREGRTFRVVPARLPEDVGAELLAGLGRLTACRALGEASLRDICAGLLSLDKAADVPDAAGACCDLRRARQHRGRSEAVPVSRACPAGIIGDALSRAP